MRKLFVPILLAGLLAMPAFAQVDAPKLAETAPDRYVVVPGDTLWGIAGRFLKDPYRWPDIWEPNKADIRNPHLIYPGNVLVLDRSGSAPRLRLATVKVEPRVRSDKTEMAVPSIPPGVIEPFLAAPLVVEEGGLANAPKIVATQQGRTLLGTNDIAYVSGQVPDNVASWQIYRPGMAFIDPDTKAVLGYEATFLGTARLERKTDPMTFVITGAKQEITAGDRLVASARPALVNYTPRAPSSDIRARVLSTYGGVGAAVTAAGSNQIIAISKGKNDGVEPGHVLALYSFGQTVRDPLQRSGEKITLPDHRNGLVFVFRVFDKISYALVMSATDPIRTGDVARKP